MLGMGDCADSEQVRAGFAIVKFARLVWKSTRNANADVGVGDIMIRQSESQVREAVGGPKKWVILLDKAAFLPNRRNTGGQ